jgi:hypothetical protein
LAPLKNLSSLDLSYLKVTNAGLKELAVFKKLTTLDLENTQDTDADIQELQKALPKCEINR